jgi:hypothetical protein
MRGVLFCLQTVTFSSNIRRMLNRGDEMDLHELEALLITAQMNLAVNALDRAVRHIVTAKLMVQAEMARIGRIKSGDTEQGDERRTGE